MSTPCPRRWHALLGAWTLAVLTALPAVIQAGFDEDCQALTRTPHRLSGTAEARQAADYVLARLNAIGADQVLEQPFPVTQTVIRRCDVTLPGRAEPLPLEPMRPNGIIPAVSPGEGITGRIVHVGMATAEDFARTSVRGAIAVMDYNTGDTWLRAFRLGAQAVIFTHSQQAESRHAHYVECTTNLPRFYHHGPASDLPEGVEATIRSEVVWQGATGRNLFAYFRGTDPIFDQEKEELLILAANLDTFGEVPHLTPGARGAANCAALLQIAEYVKAHRPRRHVLFAFFDNQARGHAGVSAFYRALETEKADHTVRTRKQSWTDEQAFLDRLVSLANSPEPLAAEADVRSRLIVVDTLGGRRGEAAFRSGEPLARLARKGIIEDLPGVRSRVSQALADKARNGSVLLQQTADALTEQAATAGPDEVDAALAAFRTDLAERCLELKKTFDHGATVIAPVLAGRGADQDWTAADREAYRTVRRSLEVDYETELEDIRIVRRELLDRLSDKAKTHAYLLKDSAYKLREEANLIVKGYRERDEEMPPQVEARVESLRRQVDQDIEPERDAWNELQRILGSLKRHFGGTVPPELTPIVAAKLEVVLDAVREDVRLRRVELEEERVTIAADEAILQLIGNAWIGLHASLMLGDTAETWGLIIGGESGLRSAEDHWGLYGKIQSTFLKAHEAYAGPDGKGTRFMAASANQNLPQTRVLWGQPFMIHSGEIAGLFGIYNLVLGTAQESVPREGTPDDTLARLDLGRVQRQAADIARMLCGDDAGDEAAVANQAGLSLRRNIVASKEFITPSFKDGTVRGPMVMGLLPGSSIPNTPMPSATVQLRLRANYSLAYAPSKPPAFDDFQILRTSRNGVYGMGPFKGGAMWRSAGGFAAIFNDKGQVTQVSDMDSFATVRWRLNVFRCKEGKAALPPQLRTDKLPGEEVKILSARANADLDRKKSHNQTADGMVAWYSEDRERGVKLFSLRQLVGLNNGPEQFDEKDRIVDPIGEGFAMTGQPPTIDVPARSAADLWRLNESRLAILRSKGIQDSSLAELHGRSEDILIEAGKESSPLRRESLATSSFWSSQPVYGKVRGMLDDLVFAVLILLGLSVPFAFAVERVVVGATTVYRQISWFACFFALTFLVLYLSHPAFAIANTPVIIFLGFAILVMSAMVIFIIMRKFEYELKALQGMTTTVHAADVSSISTLMAAMQMGVSTMRRRPLRTALTAITIVLLTFTILCFASFGTQTGIVPLFSAPNPSHSGAFVHNVNWQPLSEDLRDIIQGRWGDRLTVCRRLWISPRTQNDPGQLVSREDAGSPVTIKGVLGIDPKELGQRPDLAELLGALDDETVLITSAVANTLQVTTGDTVLMKGRRLKVGQLLDAVRVSAAKDMDTSSLLPADFTEASSTQQTTQGDEEAEMMTQRNWASLPVDQVVVVSADTAKSLGASLYGLMVYTRDTAEAVEIAEALARMLPFPIAATRDNGVYRHLLGTVLQASGAKDLFFPIVLGGLVIFGTMLGSVADRQKEIYTFSALGLAPRHVATLFFAESMVYSLIGGLGGYLLAQGTMKILGVLSEYGLVRVPEMNMSSTNTIVTILLVMATVLVSAIYPAVKASKSANPGLMRMWRPPAPQGDVLDLVFPFTVSAYDITGVVSFLREHFGNHTDTGLGRFMTSQVELARDQDGALGLDATLALAPFDLGVSQSFALRSSPSEIPGIDEVRVVLRRLSGQPKDWRRLNKVFLDDLRQQFLIWRSIPQETMEIYRERTLTALGQSAVQNPAATTQRKDA
ncbi:MAG: FtsX-like permease family protein [Lentisphaerae bacterium]|nr:FtsX-like permease family protein [Lentisphaerota bacterium]